MLEIKHVQASTLQGVAGRALNQVVLSLGLLQQFNFNHPCKRASSTFGISEFEFLEEKKRRQLHADILLYYFLRVKKDSKGLKRETSKWQPCVTQRVFIVFYGRLFVVQFIKEYQTRVHQDKLGDLI